MNFLKTAFSKFHFAFLLFASFNIIFALVLYISNIYFRPIANLHFFAGIFIFVSPLIYLLFIKDKKKSLLALKGRLYISKNNISGRNHMVIFAKTTAWIFLINLFLAMIIGVIIKTGVSAKALPDLNLFKIHTRLIFITPLVLAIHIITMLIILNPKPKKNIISK